MNLHIQDSEENFKPSLDLKWSWVSLGDLCTQDRTIVESGSELAKRLRYVGLEQIESQTGRLLPKSSNSAEDQGKSTTFAFDSRHILYSKLRPYLNKVALPNFSGRCTTELIPFLPHADVSRRYLAWLFRRPETVQFAMQGKTGSRMPRANIKELLTLRVPLPDSLEQQEKLADIIETQMNSIEQAKLACQEQIVLLDELSHQILSDFPLTV
ncbi:MAG: restriction endonuclease subunit S [Limnoraphis robusta]